MIRLSGSMLIVARPLALRSVVLTSPRASTGRVGQAQAVPVGAERGDVPVGVGVGRRRLGQQRGGRRADEVPSPGATQPWRW